MAALWLDDNNGIIGKDVYEQAVRNSKIRNFHTSRRRIINSVNWPAVLGLLAIIASASFTVIGIVTVAVWVGAIK
jgi:hypothetical protein